MLNCKLLTKKKKNYTYSQILLVLPGPSGATNKSTIPSFFALSALTVFPVSAKSKVVGIEVSLGILKEHYLKLLKSDIIYDDIVIIYFSKYLSIF